MICATRSRQQLDDLLAKLYAFPEHVAGAGANFHAIAYACQRGAGHLEEVFVDILAGRIPRFRDPVRSGIGFIYFDVNSIMDMKIAC